MARLIAVACATASIPRRSGSSIATTWRAKVTANISIRSRRFNIASARRTRWGMLLGGAGLDPQASKTARTLSRLVWRKRIGTRRHRSGGMRRTGACFFRLAMVALIFAAAPAKAGDNSIDVAVIVYDGVLTSDITAPLEVFGNAARKPWLHKIKVEAVAADGDLDILTEEGIKLKADRLLAEAPRYDAVIVPSRYRMDAVLGNRALIDFIRDQSKTAHWMASNCSGALVLAEAGVLDGKRATTWAG